MNRSFKGVKTIAGREYRVYRCPTHWEAESDGEVVAVAVTWGDLARVLAEAA